MCKAHIYLTLINVKLSKSKDLLVNSLQELDQAVNIEAELNAFTNSKLVNSIHNFITFNNFNERNYSIYWF